MATMHQDTQEPASAETPSILLQAVGLQAANMASFGMEYKAMLDKADELVRESKQAVKENITNHLIDSLSSQDSSAAAKLATTAQAAVLLAATEVLPESVPEALAMAMPVKGIHGLAKTSDVPIAGAMFSAAEKMGETLPSLDVVELAVYDMEQYKQLMLKAEAPKLLAEAESELHAAVDAADTGKMAKAARQYTEAAILTVPDAVTNARASEIAAEVNSTVIYAQKVKALLEQRFQLQIAIEKGNPQEIKTAAYAFHNNMAEIYAHKGVPTPSAQAFEQASSMTERIEEAVKQLGMAKDQQQALQQLVNVAGERDALERSMTAALKQPTALASRVLMDLAKTQAEEAIEQRTARALPEMRL